MSGRKVVVSGMRPTGRLHLGNLWGALKNWVELQQDHECWFCVVDLHMLTTGYEDTAKTRENVREIVLDWLAAGLDPAKCTIFLQSAVPQHAELALLFSMLTPVSWLENNPTWKEQLQELAKTKETRLREAMGSSGSVKTAAPPEAASGDESLRTHGFLGYPVLQTADVALYGADVIPVGKDQLPHIELGREIIRRFNSIYGPTLVEPQARLTEAPYVPGTDGRKMSKSYANSVDILETEASLTTKVMGMYTDPLKTKADSPGHPEPCPENPPGCVVYALHKLYSPHARQRGDECRSGRIGCVACKKDLLNSLAGPFSEFRSRRERFAAQKGLVEDILAAGSGKARERAERTMESVRKAMRLR